MSHWIYPLTSAICINMKEKVIQKYQIWGHTGSVQKQPTADIRKIILEYLQKNKQGIPPKLSVPQTRNILQ